MAYRKKDNKKIVVMIVLTIAIFVTASLATQKTSWFNYASSTNGWTQNQRGIGIYISPLTNGRLYKNDRIAGSMVKPAVWLSNQELINIINKHHQRIISYAGLKSSTKIKKARVFPAVIPLWVNTTVPGHQAPRGDKFPEEIMNYVRKKGGTTMLNFTVGSLNEWSNGSRDSWLVEFGKNMGEWMVSSDGNGKSNKGWPKQNAIVVRVEPEVNLPWKANQLHHTDWTSNNYKKAVTRIHDKLSQGIDNVDGASSQDMYILIHFGLHDDNTANYTPWLPANSKWDIFALSVYETDKNATPLIHKQINNTVTKYIKNNWPTKQIWLAEIGTNFENNNYARGTWLKNSLVWIQQNKYAYRRVKVFLYSDYDDPAYPNNKGKWMLRGTNTKSIAKRYGELSKMWKFQQDNIFER